MRSERMFIVQCLNLRAELGNWKFRKRLERIIGRCAFRTNSRARLVFGDISITITYLYPNEGCRGCNNTDRRVLQ